MSSIDAIDPLLLPPSNLSRAVTVVLPPSEKTPSFKLGKTQKSYKHQYSNVYFVRLRILRQYVELRAEKIWSGMRGNPRLVPRVLEVVKAKLCYIVGTVYMDMPMKPNVMEDIARDHSIPPPPPPNKFFSKEDNVMLEDESGRIRLVGDRIKNAKVVTGVIIGVLGMETAGGDFEVIDVCYPGMAPQPSTELDVQNDEMEVDENLAHPSDEWIGVVSGFHIGSELESDLKIQMLVEYLTGEGGGVDDQISASHISRLIIAGDSLASVAIAARTNPNPTPQERKARRYGYDSSTFSPHPILNLSAHLLDIGRVMPIHILPGEADPTGVIMPQQPLPRAMFGEVSTITTFSCETNPTYIRVARGSAHSSPSSAGQITRTLLVHSGQPLNDMFKYLPSPPNSHLSILESTIRWRHMAPTAPDTLWCYPYFSSDPFLIPETPDIYIAGGQNRFGTKMVYGSMDENEDRKTEKQKRCRLVMVPSFARTGCLVLINLRTLDVKCIDFSIEGMTGGGEEQLKAEMKPTIPDLPTIEHTEASSPPSSAESPASSDA